MTINVLRQKLARRRPGSGVSVVRYPWAEVVLMTAGHKVTIRLLRGRPSVYSSRGRVRRLLPGLWLQVCGR